MHRIRRHARRGDRDRRPMNEGPSSAGRPRQKTGSKRRPPSDERGIARRRPRQKTGQNGYGNRGGNNGGGRPYGGGRPGANGGRVETETEAVAAMVTAVATRPADWIVRSTV